MHTTNASGRAALRVIRPIHPSRHSVSPTSWYGDHILRPGAGRSRRRGSPDADYADPSHNAALLRDALDAVLAGAGPAVAETEPVGCSIKWKR